MYVRIFVLTLHVLFVRTKDIKEEKNKNKNKINSFYMREYRLGVLFCSFNDGSRHSTIGSREPTHKNITSSPHVGICL